MSAYLGFPQPATQIRTSCAPESAPLDECWRLVLNPLNAALRRRLQDGLTTLRKRPFGEFPLHYLEMVDNLGPLYQSHHPTIAERLPSKQDVDW